MQKISIITMTAGLLVNSNPTRAEEVKLYCSFDSLPAITVFYRGGMGASDNTIQIGGNAPVPLSIGSGFMSASLNGNSYAIGSTGVDITKNDDSDVRFFRLGGCSQDPETHSANTETDLDTALSIGFHWSHENICQAAVETYFFLNEAPVFSENIGDIILFESSSGNLYGCTISGHTSEFLWYNKQGDQMTSRSTRYSIVGSNLEVVADMQTMLFQMEE